MPYPQAYPVSCGRAGLELIIRHRQYKRVFVPAYICQTVKDVLNKIGVTTVFYYLTKSLEPEFIPEIKSGDCFIYVNYFGVRDAICNNLVKEIPGIVLDLTQAFFYEPSLHIDAFNSARKFIGVPDGGFLFSDFSHLLNLPSNVAYDSCKHLLMRADGETEKGYAVFRENEKKINQWEPMQMSRISKAILQSVDIHLIKKVRNRNFNFLHKHLLNYNDFFIEKNTSGALSYPLLTENGTRIKNTLCSEGIFVPTYWPGIEDSVAEGSIEKRLLDNLVCLPIDQRYNEEDMLRVIKRVLSMI